MILLKRKFDFFARAYRSIKIILYVYLMDRYGLRSLILC